MTEVWHVISERDLLTALHRCEFGESASLVYAEMYVNASSEHVEGGPPIDASG